ncbi:MAG TPA: Type 1 glutamine amidotransferase-like domain-containing protein [Candidatus Limnocylindrales bacterium]
MKLLLTSAGINNPTIEGALVDLLGKPIADCDALCIPTAGYGNHAQSFAGPWRFIAGKSQQPMTEIGWKSVGVLELTALPSLPKERWVSWVRNADVLLANGGDAAYLARWMRDSGLADLIPTLDRQVYVGFSGGSMALAPRIGTDFLYTPPPASDETLGLIDFSIFPHVDHPDLPENTMAAAEKWAAEVGNPAYAIDDATAIRVVGDKVDVVTEGHWRLFNR